MLGVDKCVMNVDALVWLNLNSIQALGWSVQKPNQLMMCECNLSLQTSMDAYTPSFLSIAFQVMEAWAYCF